MCYDESRNPRVLFRYASSSVIIFPLSNDKRKDAEKKKYFKIQKSHAASANAAYSSDAVKRRRIQDRAAQAARQRAHLVRNHIKRHPISRDAVYGGLLTREIGLGYMAERGRGRVEDADLAADAWARGVVAQGSLSFAPSFARARYANMPCFYVGGEDTKTGLGVTFASEYTLQPLVMR